MSWNPHDPGCRLRLLLHGLKSPRMEVAAQRMHESLSGDVEKMGKFGKFSTKKNSKFYSELGKVVVISVYVARGKDLIRP